MIIAATLAATMGVASAVGIDNLPQQNDVNFTGSIFEANGSTLDVNLSGYVGIANVNAILDAVGDTDGSDISTDNFWKSFVEPTKTEVFYYLQAKPLIAELVFTVTGEVNDNGTWKDTRDTDTWGSSVTALATAMTDKDSAVSGKVLDGQLKVTGAKAVELLKALDFTGGPATGTIGSHTCANSVNSSVDCSIDGNVIVTLAAADLVAAGSTGVDILGGDSGVTFQKRVTDARLSSTQAFVNANTLIDLIAAQLKDGYILNVANATKAVKGVIDQHNGFLSATVVESAKSLKKVIKIIGLQVAAAEVGKVADAACTKTLTIKDPTCVTIGGKFKDILSKVDLTNSQDNADAYETALNTIDQFAQSIIDFNGTVGTFDATTTASDID